MCGVCGMMGFQQGSVNMDAVRAMTASMIHRGPDDEGYYADPYVALGFRRLSIVDLSHGQQPIANEDGAIRVVFNGEIYNHKALRQLLLERGHQLRSQSDAEVIPHLYEEYGIQFVHQLRGMFAIVIWDGRTKELFLIRDYFGIKPLFYATTKSAVYFASELRTVLASGCVDRDINHQAMWDYFTFQYVPGGDTMFTNVRQVEPASYVHIKNRNISTHRYWEPSFAPDETKSLDYFVEGIREKLKASVFSHMHGDVPCGAFLSSGLDSTAVTALMRQTGAPVKTFSVGFEGAPDHLNELTYAAESARFLGTEHHDITVSAAQYRDQLPQLISAMDAPIADASAQALFYVSKLASAHVKVVLSGEGADEIFGGYPIYHEPKSLRVFDHVHPGVKHFLHTFSSRLPEGLKGRSYLMRGTTALEARFVGNANIFQDDIKAQFLKVDKGILDSLRYTQEIYEKTKHLDDITRMQTIDLALWLPGDILSKADRMSMANSLELRVPFLDRDLFEFASTIPVDYRIHGRVTKYALRQAVQSYVPSDIWMRKKLGFPVPIRQWLRGPMLNFAWDVLSSTRTTQLFDMRFVEKLMKEHMEGQADRSRQIWTILTFSMWYEQMMQPWVMQDVNQCV